MQQMAVPVEKLLKQGSEALSAGRIEEGRGIYKFLARELPRHPDVLHGLALVNWREGRHKKALELLRQAIRGAPDFAPMRLLQGDWLNERGQAEQALMAWKTAHENGASPILIKQRIDAIAAGGGAKADWFGPKLRHLAEAQALVGQERWSDAVPHYEASLAHSRAEADGPLLKEAATIARAALRLDLAAQWFEAAARALPEDADVILSLGNVYQRQHRFDDAERCYRQALALDPVMPEAHNNLGAFYQSRGQLEEANKHLRIAINHREHYADAWNNLGLCLRQQQQLTEAEVALRRGLACAPDSPDLHTNLGLVLDQLGRKEEAERLYEQAGRLAPDRAMAWWSRGLREMNAKHFGPARTYLEKAVACDPDWMPAQNALALLHLEMGEPEKAIELCQRILVREPDNVDALNTMGISYRKINRLGEALSAFETAVAKVPNHQNALCNLAFVRTDLGLFDQALDGFRQVLALEPKKKAAWDNYLFALNYHPTITREEHLAGYRDYDRVMGTVDKPCNARPRSPEGRKLKVAYLSGDLRHHPQEYFFMPLLDGHNRELFEVWCYSNGVVEDHVTTEMKSKSDGWRNIAGMSDAEVAAQITADEIDILVDLAGHTAGGRAEIYPYRAAPLQLATLLGWNYGVGLSCMDALVGDPWTLPEGVEQYCVEPVLRAPCYTYICRPDPKLPRLPESPARRNGHVVFGTTSRSVRLNDRVLELWARVLQAVPGSTLHFNSRNFDDPASIERMQRFFSGHGVDPDRLEFGFTSPIHRAFEQIDIYLDTFPHNNGTTLVEALWCGLPVVTMVDRPPFGCIGQAMLTQAGLEGWIAKTEGEYLRIAADLAGDIDRLEEIRLNQRDRIANTALFDEERMVRWFEYAYYTMYERKWQALAQEGE